MVIGVSHGPFEDMELRKAAHHEADQDLLVQRRLVACKRGVKKLKNLFLHVLVDALDITYVAIIGKMIPWPGMQEDLFSFVLRLTNSMFHDVEDTCMVEDPL